MSRHLCPQLDRYRFRQPKRPIAMVAMFACDWGGLALSTEPSFATIRDQLAKKYVKTTMVGVKKVKSKMQKNNMQGPVGNLVLNNINR